MSVIKLTDQNFKEIAIDSGRTVAVDIYTDTCPACALLEPVFSRASEETDEVIFGAVNAGRCPEIVSEFKIMSVPALLLFRKGELVRKTVGALSPAELDQFIFGD